MKKLYFKQDETNINDLYYDAMELLRGDSNDAKEAERLLTKALKLDEHNVQTHVGFAHVYGFLKNKQKAKKHIEEAYWETLKKFPNWR
ncbi:MAG: hypothetical protein AAB338_00145 [Patescibacteria group bacterium]